MINLPELAERLQAAGIMHKSFFECSKDEVLALCEAVFSSIGEGVPSGGWKAPKIERGGMVVPIDCHPKYRWWTEAGQPVRKTLIELGASWDVAKKYVEDDGLGGPMTRELWESLISQPF